jgi:transposase
MICTIPGISPLTAGVIIAETGADMTRFPTAAQLASWAGTTPGNDESAGKVKSSRTRPGNPHLQGALGAAAMACVHNPRTYLGARYRRIAVRRGPQKANVAIQHSMLIAIWHMGTNGYLYDDPGADYFNRLHPDRVKKRAINQLESMGHPDQCQLTTSTEEIFASEPYFGLSFAGGATTSSASGTARNVICSRTPR